MILVTIIVTYVVIIAVSCVVCYIKIDEIYDALGFG